MPILGVICDRFEGTLVPATRTPTARLERVTHKHRYVLSHTNRWEDYAEDAARIVGWCRADRHYDARRYFDRLREELFPCPS